MNVSIPFEQGDVFRHKLEDRKYPLNEVSIPFEQGDVFRHQVRQITAIRMMGLNPFRAGRCLSTYVCNLIDSIIQSQSLSSRAMSFDKRIAR